MIGLAVMFALADRLAGGDYVTRTRAWLTTSLALDSPTAPLVCRLLLAVINARSVAWATVALAAALALYGAFLPVGPKLAILALGFAGWRWDGWDATGAGIDPKGWRQAARLYLRHLFALPAVLPCVYLLHGHVFVGGLWLMLGFAPAATALGVLLAALETRIPRLNTAVELARGAILGAVLAAVV